MEEKRNTDNEAIKRIRELLKAEEDRLVKEMNEFPGFEEIRRMKLKGN